MNAATPIRASTFAAFAELTGLRLTRGQSAFTAVAFDGRNPAELEGEQRELARTIFGDVDDVPARARRIIAQVKGRNVGGSRLGALRALHLALTAPIELDASEAVYALFVAPKLRLARVTLRFALAAARRLGLQRESETADSFTIVRHDGRRIVFEAIAAGRGGDTGRGVPILCAVLDEAAFFLDEASGAVNDAAVFRALVPRLLVGGQVLIVSSPWVESGLLFSEFERNFGKPSTALAAHCPTLVMRDDRATRAMVEAEQERDPDNAAREFGAEFWGAGSARFFDPQAIASAVQRDRPLALPRLEGARVGCGADFAFVSDSSALVVVQSVAGVFHVSEIFELRPAKGSPLAPSSVVSTFAAVAGRFGVRSVASDGHYRESIREHLAESQLTLVAVPGGLDGKVSMFTRARSLLHEGKVRLPHHGKLVQQLRDVVSRPTSGGKLTVTMPRNRGGHGDLAAALIAAIWMAEVGECALPERLTCGAPRPDYSMTGVAPRRNPPGCSGPPESDVERQIRWMFGGGRNPHLIGGGRSGW